MIRDPDQASVKAFIAALFRHAGSDTFISLRAFDDTTKRAPPLFVVGVKVGDPELIERACARVAQAANAASPHVFCTPICTFQTAKGAKATNLAEGLALSVECDERPEAARIKLTMLLGEPTMVAASGGEWLNPETEQLEPKLHLHWRLSTPTRTKEEHQKLYAARKAATQLVGGDASNKSIVHPMRWPGSWHCKAEPRLARIVSGDPDKEIDLDEALQKLPQIEKKQKAKTGNKVPRSDATEIEAALNIIPSDDYHVWFEVGCALQQALGEAGLPIFVAWSQKSAKYHEECATKWEECKKVSGYTVATIFHYANKFDPGWRVKFKGVSLHDFYAYLPQHNYIFTPSRETWPVASINAKLRPIPIAKGKTLKPSTWLDRYRSVEQMTWIPGMPMIIHDRPVADGGWIERKGVSIFNLYLAPTIELGNSSEAGPWVEHAHKMFGDDVEYALDWFAHRVQRPAEKPSCALVLIGDEGIGKDTLLEPVKRAVGSWNFQEVSPQQIMGRFNSYVRSVILRVSEAHDLGEVNRYTFHDRMKTLIAAPPDVLRCDEKNLREHAVFNCAGVIYTTNYRTDCLYLTPDDRRHYVLSSPLKKEDFVHDYFNTLWRWYNSRGDHHVAAFLAQRDISKFDPKAPPPKTKAFWDIVDANRAPEDIELADAIDKIGNPRATTLDRITGESLELWQWLQDRRNRRAIPHRMERAGYVSIRNSDAKDGLWKINGCRQVIYAQAGLSPSEQLTAARMLVNSSPGIRGNQCSQ
jgi:hypothetical protein